jgi:hypothetical protein
VLFKRSLTALFVVLLATTMVVVAKVDSAYALRGSAYQSGAAAVPLADGPLDRGRNCKTYYHLNDPATGWGFTHCIKLQYEGNLIWATGSISTTTPGIYLGNQTVTIRQRIGSYCCEEDFAQTDATYNDFASATTGAFACSRDGLVYAAQGEISGRVFWPNGKASSYVNTWTYNNPQGWFTYYCPP